MDKTEKELSENISKELERLCSTRQMKYKCPICQKDLYFIRVTAVDDDPMFGNKDVLMCNVCDIKVEIYCKVK